jgi:ABC-type Mn2+/Zn2+ transport system permease subunit
LPEARVGTSEIISTIVVEFPYALYGSILVGALCAFLGVYIVAKRVVFLGAVLTQVSVLGLAITFLPFMMVSHTIGSLAVTILSVIVLSRLLTGKKIPKDAVLGFVFVFSIAARILIMQKTPKVEVSEIENLLRGDILFVTPELFYTMLGVFIAAMVVHGSFFKEFTYISFDAETARTQGFNADFWEMLFYVIAAVVISVATHIVGDIFVFGFLVIPPIAAMLLAKRVKTIFLLSFCLGALVPAFGLFFAFKFDFPASPTIVAVASTVLILAWVLNVLRQK